MTRRAESKAAIRVQARRQPQGTRHFIEMNQHGGSPIQELWHYPSACQNGCEGGGGKTPVVHAGQVYVRDSFCTQTNGVVLDANTGTMTGGFNSDRPPAFIGNLGVFLQSGTLVGVDIPSGQQLWSFAGDSGLQSAP